MELISQSSTSVSAASTCKCACKCKPSWFNIIYNSNRQNAFYAGRARN